MPAKRVLCALAYSNAWHQLPAGPRGLRTHATPAGRPAHSKKTLPARDVQLPPRRLDPVVAALDVAQAGCVV